MIGRLMSNEGNAHFMLFIRFPAAGAAKTRLIPALGAEGAATLHRRMAEVSIDLIRRQMQRDAADSTIWITGGRERAFQDWLGSDLEYREQPDGDLGDRLQYAFEDAFERGAACVFALGGDVPSLSDSILQQARSALQESDVVLGPAADGGYYLIGMKRFHPELFTGIEWGGEYVYAQTCNAIGECDLQVETLQTLDDIDRPDDLESLVGDSRFSSILECVAGR
jgi:rSAM/selenodomain-associated transferase 1